MSTCKHTSTISILHATIDVIDAVGGLEECAPLFLHVKLDSMQLISQKIFY